MKNPIKRWQIKEKIPFARSGHDMAMFYYSRFDWSLEDFLGLVRLSRPIYNWIIKIQHDDLYMHVEA